MRDIAGQELPDDQLRRARKRRGAGVPLRAIPDVPPSASVPGGHHSVGDHMAAAPGGEGQCAGDNLAEPALSDTCAALKALQRKRRFCIVSQSRCDRSCEAFIASQLGYTPDMDAAARAAVWKQAAAIRKAVEAGGEGQKAPGDHTSFALSASADIIRQSALARAAWDSLRQSVERDMRKLARTLPVYAWAKGVSGFGDLGLAIIVGETGDLSLYATKERVWKRLGLAVIDGFRQSRRTNAEEAAAHGFNPKRRAEAWAIADSMFRHQWRGEKEGVPAHPLGPYGAVYARRKAHTETREWTPKHRDNDARRVMTKALIEDLWRVWRGLPPLAVMS